MYKMNKYDVSGGLRTWSEKVVTTPNNEILKERLRELRKEITVWINSLEVKENEN